MVDDVVFIGSRGGRSRVDIIGEWSIECGDEERDERWLESRADMGV